MAAKFNSKKIKKVFLRMIEFIGRRFFLGLAIVLLLDLILAGIFLWAYCLREREEGIQLSSLQINQELLGEISSTLNQKKQILGELPEQEYHDPFRGWVEK